MESGLNKESQRKSSSKCGTSDIAQGQSQPTVRNKPPKTPKIVKAVRGRKSSVSLDKGSVEKGKGKANSPVWT